MQDFELSEPNFHPSGWLVQEIELSELIIRPGRHLVQDFELSEPIRARADSESSKSCPNTTKTRPQPRFRIRKVRNPAPNAQPTRAEATHPHAKRTPMPPARKARLRDARRPFRRPAARLVRRPVPPERRACLRDARKLLRESAAKRAPTPQARRACLRDARRPSRRPAARLVRPPVPPGRRACLRDAGGAVVIEVRCV